MEPLQHGIAATQTLVTLCHVSLPGLVSPGYHPVQLCPPRRFWQAHPEAPWNAPWSDSPEFWRSLNERWNEVADDEPLAPWNQPEPSRDPADYQDLDGSALLWVAPVVIPLVKLDPPTFNTATHRAEPVLVWHADRVERDWQIVELDPAVVSANARSVGRGSLRASWDGLPAYIRGPYRDKFEAANRLLDEGDDEGAIALIQSAAPAPDFDSTQLALFIQVKAQMQAGIAALPS